MTTHECPICRDAVSTRGETCAHCAGVSNQGYTHCPTRFDALTIDGAQCPYCDGTLDDPTGVFLARWSFNGSAALERFRGSWADAREAIQNKLEDARVYFEHGEQAYDVSNYDRAVCCIADLNLLPPCSEWAGTVGHTTYALEAL